METWRFRGFGTLPLVRGVLWGDPGILTFTCQIAVLVSVAPDGHKAANSVRGSTHDKEMMPGISFGVDHVPGFTNKSHQQPTRRTINVGITAQQRSGSFPIMLFMGCHSVLVYLISTICPVIDLAFCGGGPLFLVDQANLAAVVAVNLLQRCFVKIMASNRYIWC